MKNINFDIPKTYFLLSTILTILVVVFFVGFIFYTGFPVLNKEGMGFLTGTSFNYDTGEYGIFIFLAGTLIVTVVTMVIACPLSILSAIYLAEYAPSWLENIMRPMIELLVGIPSVVYGIFGLFMLQGIFRYYINPSISAVLGFIPIFYYDPSSDGLGVLLASTVLAIMILPTITIITQESIRSVPKELREASFALGSTKWETIKKLLIPTASSGILTAIILGIMRAMGETMAIVMLLGNSPKVPSTIFDHGYAMTSKILNDIGHYVSMDDPRSALFAVAAVLFMIEILFVASIRLVSRKN